MPLSSSVPGRKSPNMDEIAADALDSLNERVPPIDTLLGGIKGLGLESGVTEDALAKHDSINEESREVEDLEELMEPELTPKPQQDEFQSPSRISTPKPSTSKMRVEYASPPEVEVEYEESFASQREAAQLREDIEDVGSRLASLEDKLEALLRERDAFPGHIAMIRADINSQMTLVLDRLNAALESEASPLNIKAALSAASEAKDIASDRLIAAEGFASAPPKKNSPLATRGADLKGKRRFAPIK